ncbi:hypothetical protein D3C81_1494860 [compost metagenome]
MLTKKRSSRLLRPGSSSTIRIFSPSAMFAVLLIGCSFDLGAHYGVAAVIRTVCIVSRFFLYRQKTGHRSRSRPMPPECRNAGYNARPFVSGNIRQVLQTDTIFFMASAVIVRFHGSTGYLLIQVAAQARPLNQTRPGPISAPASLLSQFVRWFYGQHQQPHRRGTRCTPTTGRSGRRATR